MANERLTLEILAQASGQDGIDRLSSALNRFSSAAEEAANKSNKSFNKVSGGADEAHLSLRRLALGIKDVFEGRGTYAMVEGGYVAVGLGAIGIAAGVTVAAIYGVHKAMQEAAKEGEKFTAQFLSMNLALRSSNDELRVSNDRLENEIAKLEGKPQNNIKLALDEAREAADKLALSLDHDLDRMNKLFEEKGRGWLNALVHGESPSDSTAKYLGGESGFGGMRAKIAAAEGDAAKTRELLNEASAHLLAHGATVSAQIQLGSGSLDKKRDLEITNQAQRDIEEEIKKLDETERNTSDQQKLDKIRSAKELAAAVKAERAKEAEMLKSGISESMGALKSDHEVTLQEEASFYDKWLGYVRKFGDRYPSVIKDIVIEAGKVKQEEIRKGKQLLNELNSGLIQGWDRIGKEADTAGKQADEYVYSSATEGSAAEDLKSKGRLDARLAGLDNQRGAIRRSGALAPQSQAVAARISESAQLIAIDQKEAQLRLNEEAKLLSQIDQLNDKERSAQADKILTLARTTNQKIYEDETHYLELIHAERERQIESFRSEVGGIFDAITSRQPNALAQMMRSQVLGIGRTITENAAQQYLLPQIQKALPHASGKLGELLQGTPFGPDPLKGATDRNTLATERNTLAIERMSGFGTSGGGTNSRGVPGIGSVFSGSGSNPFVFSGFNGAGSTSDIGDGLPMSSGPWGESGITTGKLSAMAKYGGTAALAGAGALAAAQDFKRGGAGGALQGAGALAGVAGAVLPLISKSLAMAGPIGAIAGLGLSLLGGFLGNNPQKRENAINQELSKAQYFAPTAINMTESPNGTYSSLDYRGNIRTSSLSAYPNVTQPYQFAKTHGLFGGPATYYDVPGSTVTPYSGTPGGSGQAPVSNVTVNIHAMDAHSMKEALVRNHGAVGEALVAHLFSGDTPTHSALKFHTS